MAGAQVQSLPGRVILGCCVFFFRARQAPRHCNYNICRVIEWSALEVDWDEENNALRSSSIERNAGWLFWLGFIGFTGALKRKNLASRWTKGYRWKWATAHPESSLSSALQVLSSSSSPLQALPGDSEGSSSGFRKTPAQDGKVGGSLTRGYKHPERFELVRLHSSMESWSVWSRSCLDAHGSVQLGSFEHHVHAAGEAMGDGFLSGQLLRARRV
ncbi:hypothetical protein SELMODRAFT_423674 [Selaginella moellendorffii]|uniref:Uncharacterized protein n=1 Tax=Selaginella moellendorffii TaxID=88036 RepID=D8SMH0_SELML|nr:hypothetical protein SELMODRAFT_423674 [Selaginella moellendorffii]